MLHGNSYESVINWRSFFRDNRYYEKIGKNEPIDITDDLPFEIPETWTWIRFNEIFEIRNGFTPLKSNKEFWTNGTIPWFTIEDKHIQGEIITDTVKKINQKCVTNERIVPANSVLLCCTASIGEVVFTKIPLTSNQQFNGISIRKDYNDILFPLFVFEFCKTLKEKLISMATSTTFGFVSVKKISSLFMPVPPLKEQERIVKRIEELMPLVDEYARLEAKDKELDDKLPGMLKQSILQYAMEGKLIKQNPDDEPASVLLERIKMEKERLIKEGKIKRDKNETLIVQDDDKNYYENLPQNWCLCRLDDLAIYKKGPFGSSLTKSMFVNERTPKRVKVYEQKNAIQKNAFIGDYYITYEKYLTMRSFEVFPNEIIVSCAGTIGEIYLLPPNAPQGIINQALMKVSLINESVLDYFKELLYYSLQKLAGDSKGTAIKNIPPFEILKPFLIKLPPLKEQNRILNKMEYIKSLINSVFIC